MKDLAQKLRFLHRLVTFDRMRSATLVCDASARHKATVKFLGASQAQDGVRPDHKGRQFQLAMDGR
jgi:hypothetical protein